MFMLALGIVLAWVIPANEPSRLLGEGHFALDAGGDLLLVALLQVVSTPSTIRCSPTAASSPAKTMLRAFIIAGAGFRCDLRLQPDRRSRALERHPAIEQRSRRGGARGEASSRWRW